jgi:hypothetical protein
MRNASTIATSALLLVVGCGDKPLGSSLDTRTGETGIGGNFATGGTGSSDNGLGGTQNRIAGTGGITSTDGNVATGGTSITTCTTLAKISANNCGIASTAIGSLGITWQYAYIGAPFEGYAYVFISPTANPLDTLVCGNSVSVSSNPGGDAWCGAGTVAAT